MRRVIGLSVSFAAGAVGAALLIASLSRDKPYALPNRVISEIASPGGDKTALLLETGDWSALGDVRYYLGLRKNDSLCVLARELTEGFGVYEFQLSARWMRTE